VPYILASRILSCASVNCRYFLCLKSELGPSLAELSLAPMLRACRKGSKKVLFFCHLSIDFLQIFNSSILHAMLSRFSGRLSQRTALGEPDLMRGKKPLLFTDWGNLPGASARSWHIDCNIKFILFGLYLRSLFVESGLFLLSWSRERPGLSLHRGGRANRPINRFRPAPALSVPRGRGVRGAARGLEREVKGLGATQKKAQ